MVLMVSSGEITRGAEREVRSSRKDIETMDLDRLITVWEGHYGAIPEAVRKLLPLMRLSFLALKDD